MPQDYTRSILINFVNTGADPLPTQLWMPSGGPRNITYEYHSAAVGIGGGIVIYTVPLGRVCYLVHAAAWPNVGALGQSAQGYLTIFSAINNRVFPIRGQWVAQQMIWQEFNSSFYPPLELIAQEYVNLVHAASGAASSIEGSAQLICMDA